MDAPPAFPSSSPAPASSSNASFPMVVITVVGILAAFALLASYYAFVTKCQVLRGLWSTRSPPWRARRRGEREPSVIRTVVTEDRGLGMPFIRMLPVVKFTAAACGDGAGVTPRISVSECAVCLSEFVERERVRLLPNCSHAFHIDCIDTWLQGNARCPFCRSDVTLPFTPAASARLTSTRTAPNHRASCSYDDEDADADADVERARRHRPPDELIIGDSIVIEVRGEHESWASHGASPAAGNGRRLSRIKPAESVGDEAIDTRKKYTDEFAVQPLRRSLSMDSSCIKQLYVSVQEEFQFLAHRQV
ncbi:hypothetical protein ABZP36_018005 [Zizania latifolia]